MIRLPKKINETIKRELQNEFSVVERIFLDTGFRATSVHLIVLRDSVTRRLIILRYFGDNSYSLSAGCASMKEISEEITYQIKKFV